MNGNKKIRFDAICDSGAFTQRNEGVVGTRVDHFSAELLGNQPAKTKRNIQNKIFFQESVGADRSGILATVSGVNNNASEFQTEHAHQRWIGPAFCRLGGHGSDDRGRRRHDCGRRRNEVRRQRRRRIRWSDNRSLDTRRYGADDRRR